MTIGANIKTLRTRKGLTQSQLASASGMQLTQISRVENNDTDPKASTLMKIIDALGCSANEVFNEPSDAVDMSLEDFIESIDIRTGIDMKTVVVLWRMLDNHAEFIGKVADAYKDEIHPHDEILKKHGSKAG